MKSLTSLIKYLVILFMGQCLYLAPSAIAQHKLDIFPLQFKYHFEDDNNQTKSNRPYDSYSLAYQYNELRFEIEYAEHKEKTGNSSLSIAEKISQYSLSIGYQFYYFKTNSDFFTLAALGSVVIGQTTTEVETHFLNDYTIDKSPKDQLFGLAACLVGRIKYFVAEAEVKYLNSDNTYPQDILAYAFKMGLGISY